MVKWRRYPIDLLFHHAGSELLIVLRIAITFGLLCWSGAGLYAAVPPDVASGVTESPTKLVATCWGAAGCVSGSLHVLDTGNGQWMIDCGTIFPNDDEGEQDDVQNPGEGSSSLLPVDATAINALLLTHAHADHCGRVPLLVNSGFQEPIITTAATRLLLDPMLGGAVRFDRQQVRDWKWSERSRSKAQTTGRRLTMHWRQCRYAQQIAEHNLATWAGSSEEMESHLGQLHPGLQVRYCSACVQAEVDGILRHVHTVEYRTPIPLASGVRAGLLDAGHLPGSASVIVEVELGGKRLRVLFSGDLGNELSSIFTGPRPVPNVDAVFVEATYGDTRRSPDIVAERGLFRQRIAEAVERKNVVWIPCFALDRTQRILYELHLAQQERQLPGSLPIYCPSPTANIITRIYDENRRTGWFREEVAGDANAFSPREVLTTIPSYEKLPKPCIIVSTSNMTYTAWMRALLRRLLPETSTTIALVGYCEPTSATGRLKAGARELSINGQITPVAAQVHFFGCFSGHGDATDIDRWLGNIAPSAPIFLVHGGPEELSTRADQLRELGRRSVHIPERGRPIDLIEAIRASRGVPTPQM